MYINIKFKYILWRMGYFRDQRGIINRFLNEEDNWLNHIENTKSHIIELIKDKKPDTIAILGSGWLLDVPINEISEFVKSVDLIDIIHPSEILNKYKSNSKINFIQHDLTGGLIKQSYQLIYSKKKIRNNFIENFHPENTIDFNRYDLIISVNILNQLDIILKDKIMSILKVKHEELEDFSGLVQEFHINSLPKGKSCLITDYEELLFNKKDELVKTNNLLFADLPESENKKIWEWKFDTKMNYYDNYKVTFNVIALTF